MLRRRLIAPTACLFAVVSAAVAGLPMTAGALQPHGSVRAAAAVVVAPRLLSRGAPPNGDGTSGAPVNTVAPALSRTGRVAVGTKLTCNPGTWANDPTSYKEVWRRGRRQIATGVHYTVRRADAGARLSCHVSARNAQGASASVLAGSVTVKR